MKIQRISEYQGILGFPNLQDTHHDYFTSFLGGNLGKIYQALPWQELVQVLELKDYKKEPPSQKILGEHWLPYCEDLESMTCDATCYESYALTTEYAYLAIFA